MRELIDHIKPTETGELSVEGLLAGDLETVKSRIKTEYPFLADAVVSTGGGAIGGAAVPQQAQGNQPQQQRPQQNGYAQASGGMQRPQQQPQAPAFDDDIPW